MSQPASSNNGVDDDPPPKKPRKVKPMPNFLVNVTRKDYPRFTIGITDTGVHTAQTFVYKVPSTIPGQDDREVHYDLSSLTLDQLRLLAKQLRLKGAGSLTTQACLDLIGTSIYNARNGVIEEKKGRGRDREMRAGYDDDSVNKRSHVTVPPDSSESSDSNGINWKVIFLMFEWLGVNSFYQLNKLKGLWKTNEFYLELEPFVRYAVLTPGCSEAACYVAMDRLFQTHGDTFIAEYQKRLDSNNRKSPAKRMRVSNNEEHKAAAPGAVGVAASAALDEEIAANDTAATGSVPSIAEFIARYGDAANSHFDDPAASM